MNDSSEIEVIQVRTPADRRRFIDVQYRLNAGDAAWVPPLRSEVGQLVNPGANPWFQHAEAAFFVALQAGQPVGRICAHIDTFWLDLPSERGGGPGCGTWGMFEAVDGQVGQRLLGHARDWLSKRGMTRMVGPLSLSIWDEPGLLVKGFEHSPTVMMGHNRPDYAGWIEADGHGPIRDLRTYELDITKLFSPLVRRIVALGERNPRIRVRKINLARFDEEARLILSIINDAWSGNWGIVPFTSDEVTHAGNKLKPVIFENLVFIAEYDGEPVGFMLTLPDVNEMLKDLGGRLYPFGFARLLWRLRGGLRGYPTVRRIRVPLMGIKSQLRSTRIASQLAFMMIEYTRRNAVSFLGATGAEIGWIAEDNLPMVSIAEEIDASINRVYRIYGRHIAPSL